MKRLCNYVIIIRIMDLINDMVVDCNFYVIITSLLYRKLLFDYTFYLFTEYDDDVSMTIISITLD